MAGTNGTIVVVCAGTNLERRSPIHPVWKTVPSIAEIWMNWLIGKKGAKGATHPPDT
jgi:hypothetical protein